MRARLIGLCLGLVIGTALNSVPIDPAVTICRYDSTGVDGGVLLDCPRMKRIIWMMGKKA